MFAPENSSIVGAWGLIATLVGLLATLVGFWITLVQLNRTKTAAQAASDAVGEYQVRLGRSDAALEAARIIAMLEKTLAHLKADGWGDAATSLWEAQKMLNRSISQLDLNEEDVRFTEKNIREFLQYIRALEVVDREKSSFDSAEVAFAVRGQLNILEPIMMKAHKEMRNG